MNDKAGLFQHVADLPLVAAAGLHRDDGDTQSQPAIVATRQTSPV